MTLFNTSFTFRVDATAVQGASTAGLSGIGVFFMYRPNSSDNKSATLNPGVNLHLARVINGVPDITDPGIYHNIARCEWNQISSSSDASKETIFRFTHPVTIETGASYAALLSYDANEDFLLWVNRRGNSLVGTTTTSSGPSSAYGGAMFQYAANSDNIITTNSVDDYSSLWKPVSDVDVKFNVYIARYATNGYPILANTSLPANTISVPTSLLVSYDSGNSAYIVSHPSPRVENIIFSATSSLKQAFVGPQLVYQDSVDYPGGGVYATVSSTMANTLTASSTYSNGAAFSWTDVFGSYTGDKYIVVRDTNTFDICFVSSVISNTVLQLDEATTFINTASRFVISPVGTIDSFNTGLLTGKKNSLLFLRDSSANSSVRFTSKSINIANTSITAGGNGYSNNDVLYITGFEQVTGKVMGNYAASAKITTNSIGGVTALTFANIGAGFVNTSLITTCVSNTVIVANNASPNTSSGSGLVLSIGVGSTLYTDQTNNIFRDCSVVDIGLSDCFISSPIKTQANTSILNKLQTLYYTVADNTVSSGYVSYVGRQNFDVQLNSTIKLNISANTPTFVSRSNEYNTYYSNGVINDQVTSLTQYSNTVVVAYNIRSENDYVVPGPFETPTINFGRYIINNDYTNENTDYGASLARFIMSPLSFQTQADFTKIAEDIRFYLVAYRPANTDIQVFARISNPTDSVSFEDQDWSRLKLISTNTVSTSGYMELTYGFQAEPNTMFTVSGVVATTNGSGIITGSNTTWQTNATANIQVNDLVKVYDPLFANTNFVIAMVNTVTSNTLLTIDQVFSTNTSTGIGGTALSGQTGLMIDKIAYPHQAFTYAPNHNVVRYYNMNMHQYDNYNTLQIKVVLLSNSYNTVPRIASIRGIAVSA